MYDYKEEQAISYCTENHLIMIDIEDYIDLLEERRKEIAPRGWTIPDCVWDYFIEIVRDCGIGKNNAPAYVVDNIAINGEWHDFDEVREDDETDEELIERIEDECMAIFEDEQIALYSL